jgi:hypothetical protein
VGAGLVVVVLASSDTRGLHTLLTILTGNPCVVCISVDVSSSYSPAREFYKLIVDCKIAFSRPYNLPGLEYDKQPCSKLLTKPNVLWLAGSRTTLTVNG